MTEASQASPDVLISGAGPTGLMLALLLARQGKARNGASPRSRG